MAAAAAAVEQEVGDLAVAGAVARVIIADRKGILQEIAIILIKTERMWVVSALCQCLFFMN